MTFIHVLDVSVVHFISEWYLGVWIFHCLTFPQLRDIWVVSSFCQIWGQKKIATVFHVNLSSYSA